MCDNAERFFMLTIFLEFSATKIVWQNKFPGWDRAETGKNYSKYHAVKCIKFFN